MAQNRDAPAFQEYAASMMARTDYRIMSLEARGLLYTLRLECWVNGTLPADPEILARVLGYPPDQVRRALPEVAAFFHVGQGELRCPELDDYRDHLAERRQRQSEGGRAGAAKTNGAVERSKPGKHAAKPASNPAGRPTGKPQTPRGSLVKQSQDQNSQEERLPEAAATDEWLSAYERASRGH